jgi:hypothetical protein
MAEQMETKKEKNFFESRVTDYRVGGALNWDDADGPGEEDGPWATGWAERRP